MAIFGDIGECADLEDVQQRVNARFNSLFHYDLEGNHHAKVCSFCDEFLFCWQESQYVSIETVKANTEALKLSLIHI